jgi:hypothetical protein
MRKAIVAVLLYIIAALFMALVVRNIVLPDEQAGINSTLGPINAFLQETAGKRVTTDFQVDYASAVALIHGEDPYAVSAEIFDKYGMPPWPVNLANPHPPTTVALLLPFTLVSYQNALTAWTVLMVFAVIATIQLMGVRIGYAAPIGVALCIVWPGAYAIGNVVPLIGLGIALAYRFRDHPLLAAVGLTVAAAPKASGLILLLPFLLTMRWKPVLWTAGFMVVLALIPVLLYPSTWSRYLDVGVEAIALNAARGDNPAVLNLAANLGIPSWLAIGGLVTLTVGAALLTKDSFWPTVWLTVALLPIAWMYSLLTLLPLFLAAVRRPNPWGTGAVALGTALAVGSPPLGETWPPKVLPLVVLCGFVALLQIRETDFWPRRDRYAALLGRRRAVAATPSRHADQRGELAPDLPGSAPS